jgi:hypothetical protein
MHSAPRLARVAFAALTVGAAPLSAQLPVPPSPPSLPSIDGAPFLRFAPALAFTRGDAEGRFSIEAGLRPPEEAFGITTLFRATQVVGPFQPAVSFLVLGGVERFTPSRSFRFVGGIGTSTGVGWNLFVLEAGARTGRLRFDVRTTRFMSRTGSFDTDTSGLGELTRAPRPGPYTDGEVQWELPMHGLELMATFGGRLGHEELPNEAWGYAGAALPLPFWSRRIAAVATVGWRPSIPELRLPGGRFAGLGFRLSLSGTSVAKKPVAPSPTERASAGSLDLIRLTEANQHRLTIRTPANQTVEVRGDFTDWTPLSLVRSPAGDWSTVLVLRPGVYQIEMRIDGGPWAEPPGVVLVPDGFGGKVGVLEVR